MSVRDFRIKTGWSVKEVAKLLDTDENTLLNYEEYFFMPDLEILSEILNMPELAYEI